MCIFVFIFKKNKGGNTNERLCIYNIIRDITNVKLLFCNKEKIKSTGVFPLCIYIVLLYNMHIFFLFRKVGETICFSYWYLLYLLWI